LCSGRVGNIALLRNIRAALDVGLTGWSVSNPGCLFTGPTLGESRFGQWEPYEMRVSRTVLRAALGEIPEAYSLGRESEATG